MQGIRQQTTEQQAHLQYSCELLRLLLHPCLELGAQSLHSKAARAAAGAVQQGCDSTVTGSKVSYCFTLTAAQNDIRAGNKVARIPDRLQPLAKDKIAANLMVQ